MMIITIAPRTIAIAVPATPELGKNFLNRMQKKKKSKEKSYNLDFFKVKSFAV